MCSSLKISALPECGVYLSAFSIDLVVWSLGFSLQCAPAAFAKRSKELPGDSVVRTPVTSTVRPGLILVVEQHLQATQCGFKKKKSTFAMVGTTSQNWPWLLFSNLSHTHTILLKVQMSSPKWPRFKCNLSSIPSTQLYLQMDVDMNDCQNLCWGTNIEQVTVSDPLESVTGDKWEEGRGWIWK